jgi:hypothetical protein
MNTQYKELLEKYHLLLSENSRLAEENARLKAQLGIPESKSPENHSPELIDQEILAAGESPGEVSFSVINNKSDSTSKINLFMSLFKGRQDVYAIRWENKKKGTSGYSPVCLNQWQAGLCVKPKVPCAKCPNKNYRIF